MASEVQKTRESAVKIEERGSSLGIHKSDQVMQECSRANAAEFVEVHITEDTPTYRKDFSDGTKSSPLNRHSLGH